MSTQLAPKAQTDLRTLILSDKVREQLAMALPRYYTAEAFTVIVRTAINKNPKLAECDPTSFLTAMLTAAQMGIAPDGRNGHLIPRFNGKTQKMECQFQPDYKGLVGLVRKNDNVRDVYAEPVFEADTFRIAKGLHRDLVHEVDIRAGRGAFIGAYAVISYRDGGNSFEFMSKAEIDAIKARSQSPNAGPWATDYGEMAKKTVIRRLLKLADISQESAERVCAGGQDDMPQGIQIAPANVPSLPESTAPESSPEPTPEPEPEAPIVRRPGRPAKKLLAAEPPPETPSEPTKDTMGQILDRLSAIGKAPSDLLAICEAEKWIKPGEKLEDMPAARLDNLIAFWSEIEEELQK